MTTLPKYKQIANILSNEIMKGKYKDIHKIPDENTLANEYNVSKLTIKKSVDILVNEGLVFKKQGSGTYINVNRSTNSLLTTKDLTSPSSLTHQHKGENVTTKVLEFDIIKANEYIANSLMIDKNDFVYKVVRVRYVDNFPFCTEENYFPINIMTGLDLKAVQGSIYDFLTKKCKLKPKSYHKYIYSRPCNELEVKELQLNKNEPVSIVEQVAFLDNGTAYEYSVVCHRYDKFKYKTIVNI